MESTTKFFGRFLFIFFLMGHLSLIGFFFLPTNKLLATVLPGGSVLIESEEIPEDVSNFLNDNELLLEQKIILGDGVLSKLFSAILELRKKKFMNDDEKLALALNLLPYDDEIIGLEAGGRYYYKKPLSELSDSQWITLVNLQKIFSK